MTADTATVSLFNDVDTMDGSCATGNGAEKVVRFTAGFVGGTYEVRVMSADFLVALSVRTTCEDPATEVGCAMQETNADTAPVRFALAAQQTAYIIVEESAVVPNYTSSATITVGRVQ
jgi:hypothetical protein